MSEPMLDTTSKTLSATSAATSIPFTLASAAAVLDDAKILAEYLEPIPHLFAGASLAGITIDLAAKSLDDDGLTKEECKEILIDLGKTGAFFAITTSAALVTAYPCCDSYFRRGYCGRCDFRRRRI